MTGTFLEYLTEAQFGKESISKALRIIEKRLTLKLGKLYRYDGPEGVEQLIHKDGKQYDCYLYFLANGKAFRFNTWRYKFVSLEIWKKYGTHTNSDFMIDLSEINSVGLMAVIDTLADKIKAPRVSEVDLYFLPESFVEGKARLITEARRSNPVEFYELCKQKLGTGADFSSLDWSDINMVAAENDVQVPTFIRGQKTGKNRFSVIPPGVDTKTGAVVNPTAVADATKKGVDPIKSLMITVTPIGQDNKFKSASESKEAQDAFTRIQDALAGPPPKKELKDVNTLFGRMAQLTEIVVQGALKSLLVYGGPGIGKSETVFATIRSKGLQDGVDYIKFSGKATPSALYQTLFKWRKGGLVVFDDLDSVWNDESAINILKAALDSYSERTISWLSGRTVDVSRMDKDARAQFYDDLDLQIDADPGDPKIKYPSMFPFNGKVIFISNMKQSEFDTAILSRCAKIDMTITQEQILQRMRSILPVLGGTDVSIEKKEELLDYLTELFRKKEINALTLREFIKGLSIIRSGVQNWKDLIEFL